jgi:hypothetical protein
MGNALRFDESRSWRMVQNLMALVPEVTDILGELGTLPWDRVANVVTAQLTSTNAATLTLLEAAKADHLAKMSNHVKFVAYVNAKWRVFASLCPAHVQHYWSLAPGAPVMYEEELTPRGLSIDYVTTRLSYDLCKEMWDNCLILTTV